jgi:hypothetical protein
VCSSDYKIICLTETWLNESFSSSNFFPYNYAVYRSNRDSADKSRGGGVLIAVSNIVSGVRRGPDLELFPESVWVEISLPDGRNLLIGNHYFAPVLRSTLLITI